MKYTHLTIEEREKIQELLWEKKSLRYIASVLGRSHSSLSREIKRHNPEQWKRYTPRLAHIRALERRKSRGRKERLKNSGIRAYVVAQLKRRRSPEQIAGCITTDINETISPEAIYQFIYAQISHNKPKPDCEDLRSFLRHRRKLRQPKGTRRYQRVLKPQGPSIDTRPHVVTQRRRIGDWESDTVESCYHKPGINTLVERKTGLVFITKLAGKTGYATRSALIKRLTKLPRHVRHTVTFDNGPENRDWQPLEEVTGIRCYFAHPYHSWERGTNENTNGLIRDYFPKGTDFSTITDEELAYVERELNERPRKRHGWKSPLQVWSGAIRN